MADDPKPDPKTGDDPDAGAKKALDAERKLRRDAEAAKKAAEERTAELEKRLGALEGKGGDKTGDDEVNKKIAELEKNLADERVMRLKAEVAAEKGLTTAQAKRLTGTSKEELETDADDLLDAFPAPKKEDEGDPAPRRPPSRRPAADLKGGSDPTDEPTETDPAKLADSVPRL